MDRIDEMPSLKQMYGVINDMDNCEYNAFKGGEEIEIVYNKIRPNWENMSKDSFE